MKFRLKVQVTKKMWKTGIKVYNTIEDAKVRQEELKLVGINSIIVDELGGKLKNK